ncbi:MAG: hypothetical protein HY958_03745 [Bacteroidia bacterium]|nr:hypothetical protein [Bacteroidia bacterium]
MKRNISQFAVLLFIIVLSGQKLLGQGIGIGSPTFTPVASAILELRGTDKGFLTTRVNWAIMPAGPADGLLVYVNAGGPPDGNGFYYYDGGTSTWKKVGIPYTAGTGINITGNVISVIYGSTAGTAAEGNHTHSQLHNQQHAMTSTADHTAGNWRVFYSNGSGQVVELALGTAGQVLSSNGNSAAPSWITNSGGTVTNVSGIAPISVINNTTTPVISIAANTQASSGVVAAGGANANYVWKTDGSGNPAWRPDDNTTYTAGNGLTLTGTQFSLTTPVSITNGGTNAMGYTANQFLWYNGTSIVASGFSNANFANVSHTHANLTPGTGLTGSVYNGGAAVSDWAVSYAGSGSANSAAHSDHNHTGIYDNYQYWTLQANGGSASNITTLSTVNFVQSGSITVSKAGNTITIGSTGGGTVTSISQGTGMSFSTNPITTTGTISLANTGVTAGSYTNANITVNAQGQITLASNGSGGSLSGSGTVNYIPKWTPSTTSLGNSIMSDAGGGYVNLAGNLLTQASGYHNFGATNGSTGYGFRDNGGTLEYKHNGGSWYAFSQPPTIPGNTEWWVRPTSALYIQPMYNAYARVYDNAQNFGFFYDGNNANGGFFAGGNNGVMGTRGTVADVPIWTGDIFPFVDAGSDTYINSSDNLTYSGSYGWGYAYMGVTGGCCLDAGVRGIGLGNTSGTNTSWPVVGVMGEVIATGSSANGQQGVYGWQAAPAGSAAVCIGVVGRTSQTGNQSGGVAGYYTSSVGNLSTAFSSFTSLGLLGTSTLGVLGQTSAIGGIGVFGANTDLTSAGSYGVYGLVGNGTSVSTDFKAVVGYSNNTNNLYGYGGYFQGEWYGVYAYNPTTSSGYAVYYSGNLGGSGSKNCVVRTSQGPKALYCIESPENYFEDYGASKLVNGQAVINIDPLFLETIVIDESHPFMVYIQLTGENTNGVYVEKHKDYFKVIENNHGTSNITFDWRLVAKRKGFEDLRLKETPEAYSDPALYPDPNDSSIPEKWREKVKEHHKFINTIPSIQKYEKETSAPVDKKALEKQRREKQK